MILDSVTDAVLFLGSGYCMVSLAVVGFLYLDRKTFAFALFILLFTACANPFLKMLWKMPLPPNVGTHTYGFPSGHLQSAFVFWGFLGIRYTNLYWRIFISGFIILYTWVLYIKGYHYPIDLLGAACFGSITLMLYVFILSRSVFIHAPGLVGVLLFMIASAFSVIKNITEINQTIPLALGGLLGFSFGWVLTRWSEHTKYNQTDNLHLLLSDWNSRARLLLISSLGGAAILYINLYLLKSDVFPSQELKQFSGFLMLSLWIAASPISVISYPSDKNR